MSHSKSLNYECSESLWKFGDFSRPLRLEKSNIEDVSFLYVILKFLYVVNVKK